MKQNKESSMTIMIKSRNAFNLTSSGKNGITFSFVINEDGSINMYTKEILNIDIHKDTNEVTFKKYK